MYQTNQDKRSLRSALLLGAASAAIAGLSVPAVAQDQTVETVVVTGSRIPQTGLYSSSPVTAVGQQEMKFEGTTNVENLLNNLPSAFGDFGSNLSNGSVGTATVDLRNLGCARTLVLVDGKRLMPGDNELPCADLNQIPAALIDHIDVVTGGASAVYGSDAVAGVVNFIMRRDFEGIEFDGQYSANSHSNSNSAARAIVANGNGGVSPGTVPEAPGSVWDGDDVDGTIIMGVNSANGKGNVTAYAGYRSIQPVTEDKRDFSACTMSTTFSGSFVCAGSSTTARDGAGGRFFSLDGTENTAAPCDTLNAGGSCTIDGSGAVRGFTTADRFNFAPYNYLQRPDTRYTFGAQGHYELDKALDFYGSTMFMDDQTVAQIAPSGLFFGTEANVNCDNPFLGSITDPNSPEFAFCGPGSGLGATDDAHLFIGRRNVEGGPRQDHLQHAAYRMLFGARGDLGSGWGYDISAQYGETILSEEYTNDMSIQRIQHSLQVVKDPATGAPVCKSVLDGSDPFCVPWDIFQPNSVSPAAIKYLDVPGFREGGTREWVITGSMNGDLGAWGIQSPWAKNAVGVALGAEYRQERLENRVDLEFQTGDLAGQGGPTQSVHGGFAVSEGFGEIRVPLVQGIPWVEDLTANAGYRYSSYTSAGAVHSYKYGIEWQPVDDVRFRASFQRAVRAPNVLELFTPQGLTLVGATDPCSGATPFFSLTQCEHTGVTPNQYGHIIDCVSAQCNSLAGGNTNLKPESSDTRELGVVFTPTFIDGFTATVDYFNIRLTGAIGTLPFSAVLDQCATLDAAGFCNLIHRGASGILFGTGPTAGFVTLTNINTGALQTKGMDFEANYTTDLSSWGLGDNGGLSFNFLGTWTKDFINTPFPGAPSYNCAGLFGIVCGSITLASPVIPEWRHKLRATWTSPWDFDFSVDWRHISSVNFDGNTSDPSLNAPCGGPCNDKSDANIGSFDYIDLAVNWTVHEGIQLHAGVNNVFDKDPPFLDSNALGVTSPPFGNGNTYPQVYDALGRYVFVGATIKY